MIPLKDDNPTQRIPFITIAIIALNILVFFYTDILGFGDDRFILHFAAIPINIISMGDFTGVSSLTAFSTIITSQFLHGGFLHLAGNMLFLWIFGNNIEDKLGPIVFLFFYLICGVFAFLAQMVGDMYSQIPMIGASGAIAGVMGAYLIAFPKARVLTLIWIVFYIRLIWLPAFVIIVYWVFLQIIYQIGSGGEGGGVAYLAHIGGFISGLFIFLVFKGFSQSRPKQNS